MGSGRESFLLSGSTTVINPMKMSAQGRDLLEQRESRRHEAYLDSKGIPTIGIGHTGPEVHLGLYWTSDQIDEAFEHDLAWVEKAINDSVEPQLEPHQFDALGSFTYNVGADAESHSTLVRDINEGKWDDIPAQFDRWHIPPEVTTRRNGEREQWKGTMFAARIDSHGNPI